MKKIFKIINKLIRTAINFLVRLISSTVYFVLFFPFAIFVKLYTDFLEIKKSAPRWIKTEKIKNITEFLIRQ